MWLCVRAGRVTVGVRVCRGRSGVACAVREPGRLSLLSVPLSRVGLSTSTTLHWSGGRVDVHVHAWIGWREVGGGGGTGCGRLGCLQGRVTRELGLLNVHFQVEVQTFSFFFCSNVVLCLSTKFYYFKRSNVFKHELRYIITIYYYIFSLTRAFRSRFDSEIRVTPSFRMSAAPASLPKMRNGFAED